MLIKHDGIMKKSICSSMVSGLLSMVLAYSVVSAQTVSVKFRYQPDAVYPRVHFPGNFTGTSSDWGPNTAGTIAAGTVSQADSLETISGLWVKTLNIKFGTYQYKIYRQKSANPTDWSWISDPLNRVVVTADNNSQIVVDSLVLFQLLAYPSTGDVNTKFIVKSATPNLSAGIFQPAGAPALNISLWIDGVTVPGASSYYNTPSGILTYKPGSPLADGVHTMKITASAGSLTKTDSISFETRGRTIQIQSPSFTTRKNVFVTAGVVLVSVDSVSISVNGISRKIVVTGGAFIDSTSLVEGKNIIKISGGGGVDSVVVTRIINHTPFARAAVFSGGTSLMISASGSTDPDGETLSKFAWLDDPVTPLGLNGLTGVTVSVPQPKKPGEYYYYLIATDGSGNADTLRTYVTINPDGSYTNPTIASNPSWAKHARVYFMFPKGITQTGTLNAAALKLQYVHDMGFNVIWLMPVMKNASPINNNTGPGYNIVDFYNVAPEYGTNQDFKNFISQAHALGIKVILDVTPNHSSWMHPWSVDAHANKTRSPYWNWYQHQFIAHNDNGLGQTVDGDGFYYYGGFSSQLLNLNWTDVDMQAEMINAYKYWITNFGLDGYRFDVYWGPHRRYGEQYMGKPVRDALKHIKPDILLLGEDDGTGTGTETIYADVTTNGANGGLDAAYDFKLFFNQIRGFGFNSSSVVGLNSDILNGGFYPGPNALYMRFMESQDEDRIAYVYSSPGGLNLPAQTSFLRTMPMATTIFTVPGFPMIWNGQEIGYGYGMSGTKENRTRTVIDWNYQGKTLLVPHYQRLAWIRGTYPAFATQSIIPISTGNGLVYGYTRPYANENAIVLENFADVAFSAAIPLTATGASPNVLGVADGKKYYMNDVYNDSSSTVTFSGGLATLNVTMPAYGSAVYILSDSLKRLVLPSVTGVAQPGATTAAPLTFGLAQNYPNPFNPSTTIGYTLASAGKVTLKVYDLLGREVAVLANSFMPAGAYHVQWNAAGMPSGMYVYALTAGSYTNVKRMMVVK
jgi:cyclomaltodextrinase / maltogenic alpha-amylase / neopullulanase